MIVDLDAHGGGTYSIVKRWPGVMDFNHRMVRTFETLEDAEAFVAEANGTDVETVRRDTHDRARMLDEYRQNLKRANPKNSLSRPGGDT